MKKVIAIFIAFILGGCAAPTQPPLPTLPPSLTPTWTNSPTSTFTSTPKLTPTPTRTPPPGPPFLAGTPFPHNPGAIQLENAAQVEPFAFGECSHKIFL